MIPLTYEVEMNFKEDWKNYLISLLNEYGYTINPNLSPSDVSRIYFNWRRRVVDLRRRRVHISKEFKCPKKYRNALPIIKKKIEMGGDLTPHLSKNIKKVKYNDLLLNDWGVHHLHLEKKYEDTSKEFIKRTKDVLFVKFDNENAYFIQILDHTSFSDQDLITIIHNNWPDTIKGSKLVGVQGLKHPYTDQQIHQLRKAGANTFIEVEPGIVYAPLGKGITGARTSTQAAITSGHYLNNIALFEKHIKDNLGDILSKTKIEAGVVIPKKLEFKLIVDPPNFKTLEMNTNIIIDLGTL